MGLDRAPRADGRRRRIDPRQLARPSPCSAAAIFKSRPCLPAPPCTPLLTPALRTPPPPLFLLRPLGAVGPNARRRCKAGTAGPRGRESYVARARAAWWQAHGESGTVTILRARDRVCVCGVCVCVVAGARGQRDRDHLGPRAAGRDRGAPTRRIPAGGCFSPRFSRNGYFGTAAKIR